VTEGTPPPRRIVRLARITDPVPDEPVEPAPSPDARDEGLIRAALEEAHTAASLGEVPVGAVVARGGTILARAHNLRETSGDPTAHAEILVLREAARRTGSWRLEGLTLAVTLEPCPMCAGALVLARIDRLVFGASDPKAGAVGSLMDLARDPRLNHRIDVRGGVLSEPCGDVLRAFFAARRGDRTGSVPKPGDGSD
jgi:tRNA(adenine34) deaminase